MLRTVACLDDSQQVFGGFPLAVASLSCLMQAGKHGMCGLGQQLTTAAVDLSCLFQAGEHGIPGGGGQQGCQWRGSNPL